MQHPVLNFELKQCVTRWKIDFVSISGVPAGHDQPARVWIAIDLGDEPFNLIDPVARWILSSERSPQIAVDRSQVAGLPAKTAGVFFIGPLRPNVYSSGAEIRFVCIAGKKPK